MEAEPGGNNYILVLPGGRLRPSIPLRTRHFFENRVDQRATGLAKKHPPHVVIHADDFVPKPVEVRHRLRPNQPGAAGYQNLHPAGPLPERRAQIAQR